MDSDQAQGTLHGALCTAPLLTLHLCPALVSPQLELVVPIAVFWLFIWIRSNTTSDDPLKGIVDAVIPSASEQVMDYHNLFDSQGTTMSAFCNCFSGNYCVYVNTLADATGNWPDDDQLFQVGIFRTIPPAYSACGGQNGNGKSGKEIYATKSHLAVVANGNDATADKFKAYMTGMFPDAFTFADIVDFETDAELNSYLKGSEYSTPTETTKAIKFAVVFNAGYPTWDYTLRVNFTDPNSGIDGPPRAAVPPTEKRFNHATKQTGSNWGSVFETNSMDCNSVPCSSFYNVGGSNHLPLQQVVNDFILASTMSEKGLTPPISLLTSSFARYWCS